MERRHFIEVAGITLLAGCSSKETSTTTTTTTKIPEPPKILISSENFKPESLTYSLKLKIQLKDATSVITHISSENTVPSRTVKIKESGETTIEGLTQGQKIEFESNGPSIDIPLYTVGHITTSQKEQSKFEGLTNRTYPDPSSTLDDIQKSINWTYQNSSYSITAHIPKSVANYLRKRPRVENNYGFYFLDKYEQFVTTRVSSNLKETEPSGKIEKINYISSFVQSLPNTPSNVIDNPDSYTQFPTETLLEKGGDSEDLSLLLGSLLTNLGFDAAIISLENHMLVGVSNINPPSGTYIQYNGNKYYVIEPTSRKWSLGELPDAFSDSINPQVFFLDRYPVLNFDYTTKSTSTRGFNIQPNIINQGDMVAQSGTFEIKFATQNNTILSGKQIPIPNIPIGNKQLQPIQVFPPSPSQKTRLVTTTKLNGQTHAVYKTSLM